MFNITEQNPKEYSLRHQIDETSGVLYLSIVDVIEMLRLSTDSRNYWKTLKSRLKHTHNKLVTNCNQVKMRASDGKNYLTDATDIDNMLLLIQHMAPEKVTQFRKIFKEMEQKSKESDTTSTGEPMGLSTDEKEDYELEVDSCQNKDTIFLTMMVAGVAPEDISILVTCKNILIKGERKQKNTNDEYIHEELSWGKFSREITLLEEIDIDAVETNLTHGMLQIKLPIIDKSRTKIIKIRS